MINKQDLHELSMLWNKPVLQYDEIKRIQELKRNIVSQLLEYYEKAENTKIDFKEKLINIL